MKSKLKWIVLAAVIAVAVIGAAGVTLWRMQDEASGCPIFDKGERLLCEQNTLVRLNTPIDSVYAALFSSLQGDERLEAYKHHMIWSGERKVLLNSSVGQVGRDTLMRQIRKAMQKPESVAQCQGEDALKTNDCAGWRMIRLYREQLAKLLELYPDQTQKVLTQIADEQTKVFLLQGQ